MDYNPLKGMLVFISSLKLSTVPYAAGPESRGDSRTAWLYIDVKLLPNVSLFVGFLILWINLPTKICTPRIKVISQYSHETHFIVHSLLILVKIDESQTQVTSQELV